MPRSLTRCAVLSVALAMSAALAPIPGVAAEAPAGEPADAGLPALPELHTVTGAITHRSPGDRAITIGAPGGPVTLRYDRNTSVYGHQRLGSVRDLRVGVPVRAQFGPERHAYWIELLSGASSDVRRERGPARAPRDGGTDEGPPVLPAPAPGTPSAAQVPAGDGGPPPGASRPVEAGPPSPEPPPDRPAPPSPAPPGASPAPGRP